MKTNNLNVPEIKSIPTMPPIKPKVIPISKPEKNGHNFGNDITI